MTKQLHDFDVMLSQLYPAHERMPSHPKTPDDSHHHGHSDVLGRLVGHILSRTAKKSPAARNTLTRIQVAHRNTYVVAFASASAPATPG